MMDLKMLYGLGIALIVIGVLVALVAVVFLFISNSKTNEKKKKRVKSGGIIIIGPFPIVFGTDKESIKTILLLAIALTILLATITVIFYVVLK